MNGENNHFLQGEDALVARLIARWPSITDPIVIGPGDDCAVIAAGDTWQLLKTDAMVEGLHFSSNESMRRVGRKAIARVQSDFAAMGGRAEAFVVTLFLPAEKPIEQWEQLYDGMADAARNYGGVLCGGETSRAPEGAGLILSVAGTGRCLAPPLLRSGARPGHLIFVTGVLGGSSAGHHLDFTPRVDQAEWLARSGMVSAMMDLSDGLAKDLPRLCLQSGIGAQIDYTLLPCRAGCDSPQAMNDGEDYELLFTIGAEHHERIKQLWSQSFPDLPLTSIGHCVEEGRGMAFSGGWDPFAKSL